MYILMTKLCPKSRGRFKSAQSSFVLFSSPPAESKTWRVTQAEAAMHFKQKTIWMTAELSSAEAHVYWFRQG